MSYYDHKKSKTNPLLPYLPKSNLFLDSHDDCYLYLESYNSHSLKRVFERASQIYSGTILSKVCGYEAEIAGIPAELVESLWPEHSCLTIIRHETVVETKKMRIGVSQVEFSFRENREYPIALFIEYDAASERWSVSN